MAWTALKAAIAAVIKTNGNKEINGAVLQSTLNTIVSNLGENATFKGIATPTTVPGTPDGNIFYMATIAGIYSNFNGYIHLGKNLVLFRFENNIWNAEVINIVTDNSLDYISMINARKLEYNGYSMSNLTGTIQRGDGFLIQVEPFKKYIFKGLNFAFPIAAFSDKPIIGDNSEIFLGTIPVEDGSITTIENCKYICSQLFNQDTNQSTDDDYIIGENIYSHIDNSLKNINTIKNSVTFPNVGVRINNDGSFTSDYNYSCSDLIQIKDILSFEYYLSGIGQFKNITFYTSEDRNSIIDSFTITAGTNVVSVITGKLNLTIIPNAAKYVCFGCVTNPMYYIGDNYVDIQVNNTYFNKNEATTVLYSKRFNIGDEIQEFSGIDSGDLEDYGVKVNSSTIRQLNKYYSINNRTVRYYCVFSSDSVALFTTNTNDTAFVIDIFNKTINCNSLEAVSVPFLSSEHRYIVQISKFYQNQILKIYDMNTGDEFIKTYTFNGTGGVGSGAIGELYNTGMQHDYYCFSLISGGYFHIKNMMVLSEKCDYDLLVYGDSITEPESYFPNNVFSKSWTQLLIQNSNKKICFSGRGGNQIYELITRIKNELPYVKAKYVMVTIGTNGGNTIQLLSELMAFIISCGAIPILNHIPCNESGTQIDVNAMIDIVRNNYMIKGANFDLCTSINMDGINVDTTKMWDEQYGSNHIYHHPNVKGSMSMLSQLLIDVPEIF